MKGTARKAVARPQPPQKDRRTKRERDRSTQKPHGSHPLLPGRVMKSWIPLALAIAVYDTWLIRARGTSLSAEYAAAARTHPVAVTAATAYLMAHLYGVLPHKTDLLRGFGALHGRSSWQTTRL